MSAMMQRAIADMFEAGIVDPAKVTRAAVQNAASFKKSSLGLQREKARD